MKSRILWSAVIAAGLAAAPAVSFAQKENSQEITQAVQQRMKAGLDLRNMEKAALDNDQKVIVAKEKLEQAEKDWSALQSQVDEAVKGDPDYQKAEETHKATEDKLAGAKKALADQSKAQAAQKAAEEKAKQQQSQSSSRYGGGGGYSSGGSSSYSSTPTTPKVNPLASQIKAVKDAQDEVNKAKLALNQIKIKTQRSLETKDDWKAAKAALDKAKSDYEAAKRPVLEALKKDPQFLALQRQEAEAQAKIDASR